MAINKPNIPDTELPEDWGGTQYPYTEEQIENGLPEAVPTVIDGGNLNYEKRGLFQNIKYLRVFSDWLRSMPIGKFPFINANGQLDYETPVLDSSVVHNTGDETIGGVKTFSGTPILTNATGNRVAVFNANKQLVSDSNVSTTEISYLDGLTGNVQTQLNDTVKTSGDQTLTGVKTAVGANWGARCTSAVDTGTSLSAMEEKGLLIQDKNGQRIGTFFSGQLIDGRLRTYMCSSRRVNGTITDKTAEIVQAANGEGTFQINCNYAIAPTPTSTDNSTKIATTAWVNTRLGGTGTPAISKAGNGYVKFQNGLIIQWGETTTPNTVTFPTAFTAVPRVALAQVNTSHDQRNVLINTVTKTSFYTFRYGNEVTSLQWIAIGY